MYKKIKRIHIFFFCLITIIAVSVALWSRIALAASPDVAVTEGIVAASSPATFSPATKGPVAFSGTGACPRFSQTFSAANLQANPIQSSITESELEAGSIVTFAMVLQNIRPGSEIYNIYLKHDIPDGFELPGTGEAGANLCAYNAAGIEMPRVTNGAGFFGPTENDNIQLLDGDSGALEIPDSFGYDIGVITFDLRVSSNYKPGTTKVSTSELLGYSIDRDGDMLPGSTASTSIKMRDFAQTKQVIGTSQPSTADNFVTIGEKVNYELTVTVPQGVSNTVTIADMMSPGLAFVQCDSITNNAPSALSTDIAGGFTAACNDPTNPTVTSNGKNVTFSFGNLNNTNRSQTNDETFTIRYTGVVDNVPQAVNGASLNNAVRLFWTGSDTPSESAPVIVHEPLIQASTVISPSTELKIGSKIRVTTTISHAPGSATGAYRLNASYGLPVGLRYVPASLVCAVNDAPAGACTENNGQLSVEFSTLALGQIATVVYEAEITPQTNASLSLDVPIGWAGVPTAITTPQSPYSPTTVSRTSSVTAPGGSSNTYAVTAAANVAVAMPGDPSGSNNGNTNQGSSLPATGMSWWVVMFVAVAMIIGAGMVFKKIRR